MRHYNWGNVRIMLEMAKKYGMTPALPQAVKACIQYDINNYFSLLGKRQIGYDHPLFAAYRRYVRVQRLRDALPDTYIFGDANDQFYKKYPLIPITPTS